MKFWLSGLAMKYGMWTHCLQGTGATAETMRWYHHHKMLEVAAVWGGLLGVEVRPTHRRQHANHSDSHQDQGIWKDLRLAVRLWFALSKMESWLMIDDRSVHGSGCAVGCREHSQRRGTDRRTLRHDTACQDPGVFFQRALTFSAWFTLW